MNGVSATAASTPGLDDEDDALVAARSGTEDGAEVELRCARVTAEQHGLRLDKWLVQLAPEFSRSHLQLLIEQGCVRSAGRVLDLASRKVVVGAAIEVQLRPTAQSSAFRPEAMALDVVHEDAHLMVIHKPAGLVVHPAAGHWSGTLLNGLLAHHAGAAVLPRAGIVHRLDKDTSGLMLVAKTLPAQTALVRAIAERRVRREYLALVHGAFATAELAIDAPIGRDPVSRVRMAVVAGGKPARTDARRIAGPVVLAGVGPASAVHCRLHTGRTHQIRVHLASRGHALLGDALYGGRPLPGLARQALHAARLALAHPIEGHALRFEAALPEDLATIWHTLADSPFKALPAWDYNA